jgi:GT2 family glycosyltransferase
VAYEKKQVLIELKETRAVSPQASVIVLNYNGATCLGELLDENLESVLDMAYSNFEVVFVDNGSTDNSVEHIRGKFGGDTRLKIVELKHNFGYAGGNNLGARHCSRDAKYLIFLNNDTIVRFDLLTRAIGVLQADKEIGSLYPWATPLDGNHKSASARARSIEGGLLDVPFSAGWCLVIRKQLFETLNGFDDDFFICGEDVDLGWRVWLAGYRNVLLKGGLLRHKGGGTATWESPEVFYFRCRNKILTIFKNAESRDLLRFLLAHIGISIASSLCRALKRVEGGEYIRIVFPAIIHGLKGGKESRKKRIVPVSRSHYEFARQSANLHISSLVKAFLAIFHETSS